MCHFLFAESGFLAALEVKYSVPGAASFSFPGWLPSQAASDALSGVTVVQAADNAFTVALPWIICV